MIDIHSAKTDSMGHMTNTWTSGDITEKDYLDEMYKKGAASAEKVANKTLYKVMKKVGFIY